MIHWNHSGPLPALKFATVVGSSSSEDAKIGGYGIHLVRSSTDACVYRRRGDRNVFMAYFGRTGL